jgi:hypothetical protein
MSEHLLAPILASFKKHHAAAARHCVGGVPLAEDLKGIYRRVASEHGATPEDVKRWVEMAK